MDLTNGIGAESVLESVGMETSMQQAMGACRPVGTIGYVGVPHGVAFEGQQLFFKQQRMLGGPAPVRRFLPEVKIVPSVNQIELHPYFTQVANAKANADASILTQAWSPMGGITYYYGSKATSTFTDATLVRLGERHGKTPAQIMLRWHIQQGRQVIPKSTHAARIAQNFDIFDFALTDDELAAIDALDTGKRGGPDPEQPQPGFLSLSIPEA